MWKLIKKFCRDSEVLFLARAQVIIGAVATIITYFQPELFAPVLPPEWLPWAMVAHGLAMDYLRRRRATDL